jgi:hypothetical protein
MITDNRADQAFDWLNSHTKAIGEAKAELERAKILQKRVRNRLFLLAEGAVEARKATADINEEVEKADERYCKAVEIYESMTATQSVETIALDVWRTESANRRRA